MIRSSGELSQLASYFLRPVVSYSTALGLNKTLNLFVCAADVSSDRVAAALVTSLKQLHPRGVKVYGVGGPALLSEGLQSVVSDKQYDKLATAEMVPPTRTFVSTKLPLPGVCQISNLEYLKVFRDAVWEAALQGCSSSSRTAQQHTTAATSEQQGDKPRRQQQQPAAGGLPAGLSYDAVLAVGSPLANQQLLFGLRMAEKQKVARLPVMVQYMPHGLWDYAEASSSSKALAQFADHVMCGLPFEPAVMEKAATPASFVGHPILERLLQRGQFGNLRRHVGQLLQQQAAADSSTSSSGISSSRAAAAQSLFTVGNTDAFWQDYERLVVHPAASSIDGSTGGDSAAASSSPSSSPSSSRMSAASTHKRKATSPKAADASRPKQDRPQLLCLLPGTSEAEISSSMPAFDLLTKDLAQKRTDLAVAVIVPDLLVEATQQAVQNFSLPAVVAPEDHILSTNALAAAAVAISHPGVQSLRAAAAGTPMVCVRAGSAVLDCLFRWKNSKVLPFGCIPNLVLGYEAVPEILLWSRGGQQAAVDAVERLLKAAESATSSTSRSGSGWQQQQADLQQVLLRLVPPLVRQQAAAARGGQPAAAAAAGVVQSPSEAAAAMLLDLVSLRKQQQEEQMQALVNSGTSSVSS